MPGHLNDTPPILKNLRVPTDGGWRIDTKARGGPFPRGKGGRYFQAAQVPKNGAGKSHTSWKAS